MGTAKNTCQCGKCDHNVKTTNKVSLLNVVSVVLYVLLPKCAICWAAYASLFSYLGLGRVEYSPVFQFVVLSILIIGSIVLLRMHYNKKAWFNIYLYVFALGLMAIAKYYTYDGWLLLTLITVLMLASNLSFSRKMPEFQRI
jgi:mercuric ion transport protein